MSDVDEQCILMSPGALHHELVDVFPMSSSGVFATKQSPDQSCEGVHDEK